MSFRTPFNFCYLVVETPNRTLAIRRGTLEAMEAIIQQADTENCFVYADSTQVDQKTERLYILELPDNLESGKLILRTSILRNKLTCNRTNKTIIGTASIRHPDSELEAERFRSILLPS